MKKSLDALLADPRVWRGRQAPQGMRTLSSGYRALDAILPGGGWPRAGLTEIVVERWGTGELQMIVPLLRQLSDDGHDEAAARHGWIAWIAPPYVPYAPALATAGIDVARLLLVHAAIDSEVPVGGGAGAGLGQLSDRAGLGQECRPSSAQASAAGGRGRGRALYPVPPARRLARGVPRRAQAVSGCRRERTAGRDQKPRRPSCQSPAAGSVSS